MPSLSITYTHTHIHTLQAEEVALKAVGSLSGRGVYGVELFLLPDDTVRFMSLCVCYTIMTYICIHV